MVEVVSRTRASIYCYKLQAGRGYGTVRFHITIHVQNCKLLHDVVAPRDAYPSN